MILVPLADVEYWKDIPIGTLRRWIKEGRITKFHDRPCMVDLLQVEDVIKDIGPGRNRARKTRREVA